jgi:hypothetical protein
MKQESEKIQQNQNLLATLKCKMSAVLHMYVDVSAVNTSTQVICNCQSICSMHHVLICSCMFLHFTLPTPCYCWHQCTHITVTALQHYSLHTQSLYTNKHVTDSHTFPQYTAAGTCNKLVFITKTDCLLTTGHWV